MLPKEIFKFSFGKQNVPFASIYPTDSSIILSPLLGFNPKPQISLDLEFSTAFLTIIPLLFCLYFLPSYLFWKEPILYISLLIE